MQANPMKPKTNHGGKRPGSGRRKGSVRGRHTTTRSISLPPAVWAAIDEQRGDMARGTWLVMRAGLSIPK